MPKFWFWLVVLVPALAYTLLLIFSPGRVLGWERAASVSLAQVWPLALGFVLYAIIGHFAFQLTQSHTRRRTMAFFLALFFVGSIGLQIAATAVVEPYPLRGIMHRQYSQFSSGYFTVGARIADAAEFIDHFVDTAPTFPIHPRFNPPALPLVFWASTRLASSFPTLAQSLAPTLRPLACFDELPTPLSDTQILGGFIGSVIEILLATLVLVPLYGFVSRNFGQRAGLLAAWLYPITACMLMWVSRFNRAYPLLAVAAIWLCDLALASPPPAPVRRIAFFFLMGLVLALGLFFTVANAALLPLAGLYALVRVWERQQSPIAVAARLTRQLVTPLATVALGFTSFWAVLVVGFGFDPIGSYRTTMNQHFTLDRPYWPWALYSALDIFNFIGLPLAAIASLAMWRKWAALAAAFSVPIAIMAVTRLAHDETGRLLMYFAPLAVALAAAYLHDKSAAIRGVVIGATLVQLFVHIVLLRVIGYGTDPLTVPNATLPVDAVRAEIRYERAGQVQLLGYNLPQSLKAGAHNAITLYWKLDSTAPLTTSYKVFIHIAPDLEDQSRVVNADGKPLNWALPTTCWQPGATLADRYEFVVDANAQAGEYLVLVGLYNEFSNQRAHIHTAQRAKHNAVALPQRLRVVAQK
jgi:hypothetical protein